MGSVHRRRRSGCGGKNGNGTKDRIPGDSTPPVDCDIDPSFALDAFYEGMLDTDLNDTICPRRDEDYWRINVPTAGQIVVASATFTKFSGIRLAMNWIGPKGLCVSGTS